jgi:hypothetical protein
MSEAKDSGGAVEGETDLVPGRSCEGCTLCCKLMEVEPLNKPRAEWCPHCDQKAGCRIYGERPEACRIFYCGYRRVPEIDERWFPAKAKLLVNYESASNRVAVHVDPKRADSWRAEPFYSALKLWSRRAIAEGGTVVVWIASRVIVILPDSERDLGPVREDQFILPVHRSTARGPALDYELVEADDPRLKT